MKVKKRNMEINILCIVYIKYLLTSQDMNNKNWVKSVLICAGLY
jgi:hypothetical protein